MDYLDKPPTRQSKLRQISAVFNRCRQLSVFAIVSGVFSLVGRKLQPRLAMMLGAFASSAGMGLVALAVGRHSLPIFLLATATAGAGYSLLFLSAHPRRVSRLSFWRAF